MAITADVDLGNGATASSCYLIIPQAYVKKFRPEKDGENATYKLIYDVSIYQNKAAADTHSLQERNRKRLSCRAIDHFKIDYDVTTTDNPWKLAYTDLKTNGSLSSIADA